MKWSLAAVAALAVGGGLVVFLLVKRRTAYDQKPDEIVVRELGERRFGAPRLAQPEAQSDLVFAWVSQIAYGRAEGTDASVAGCPKPEEMLGAKGWKEWPQFLSPAALAEVNRRNLRAVILYNPGLAQVIVGFAGTNPKKLQDWIANFRWFIPIHDDEYTQIIGTFGPKFVEEFLAKKASGAPEWAFLSHATLFSTGHSLGGGLAQEFAYSLESKAGMPRVTKVFAFDPSPVTGFYSVDKTTRDENVKELQIDRIFERREILSILRSLINLIYPPAASSPAIRELRYSLFDGHGPIATRTAVYRHSMPILACKIYGASRAESMPK